MARRTQAGSLCYIVFRTVERSLLALSETAQKIPSISFIPDNLFLSISAHHDMVDGIGQLNPRRS
jgi:hypothetical protein